MHINIVFIMYSVDSIIYYHLQQKMHIIIVFILQSVDIRIWLNT